MTDLDAIDRKLLRLLQSDGRMANAKLAEAVGLSPSACLRRLRLLEHRGVIRGYTTILNDADTERKMVVIAQITLERQTEEFLDRFETAVRKCAEVRECYLMSGASDYLLRIEASDAADYERIHKDQLSRLPGIARIHSSFAIRGVIRAGVAAAAMRRPQPQ